MAVDVRFKEGIYLVQFKDNTDWYFAWYDGRRRFFKLVNNGALCHPSHFAVIGKYLGAANDLAEGS